MERAKAIDKVRKLRALAEGRGGTAPERELAAKRARELMATHGLEDRDVAEGPTGRSAGYRPRPARGGSVPGVRVFVDGVPLHDVGAATFGATVGDDFTEAFMRAARIVRDQR